MRSVAVLARAQQDTLWNRQQLGNQLRSLLREYCSAALAALVSWKSGLCRPEALALLQAAPTATDAAPMTRTQIGAALKKAGRQRGIEAETERLRDLFRSGWAQHPALTEQATGRQMPALRST
ncbi:hypothetical protein AB0E66_28010 [Streptomyces sp. NPDC033753]|uniref:hypothetical protein n=1 Tax=Streptomyces sp. NPDC033753 TaxID=3155128 RepID=UPI0033E8125D